MRDAPPFEEGQRRCERLLAEYLSPLPEACRCLADATKIAGAPYPVIKAS
jgi:hypothetical protein